MNQKFFHIIKSSAIWLISILSIVGVLAGLFYLFCNSSMPLNQAAAPADIETDQPLMVSFPIQ